VSANSRGGKQEREKKTIDVAAQPLNYSTSLKNQKKVFFIFFNTVRAVLSFLLTL
jgi:hypothetical protein